MLKLLQKLTESLSIKSIVILGVVIMAFVITAFGITMTYLSSTIKYDQNTLKHILKLESQNQDILNVIKDMNYLNNQIMLSDNYNSLMKLENKLISEQKFETFFDKKNSSDFLEKYNTKIKDITTLINSQINLEKEIFATKSIKLNFLDSVDEYRKDIEDYIHSIETETENIYGISSLLSKRYNRKLKLENISAYNSSEITTYSTIMTLTKELDSAILKLPTLIYTIISSKDEDLINTTQFNNINQLVLLFENNILKIEEFKNINSSFEVSINSINIKFMKIKELTTFLITLKKTVFKRG